VAPRGQELKGAEDQGDGEENLEWEGHDGRLTVGASVAEPTGILNISTEIVPDAGEEA
jgi:hypothetical protein